LTVRVHVTGIGDRRLARQLEQYVSAARGTRPAPDESGRGADEEITPWDAWAVGIGHGSFRERYATIASFSRRENVIQASRSAPHGTHALLNAAQELPALFSSGTTKSRGGFERRDVAELPGAIERRRLGTVDAEV
jgi:hypothetical protein